MIDLTGARWSAAELNYLQLLNYVLHTGEPRADRTGVGTIARFSETFKCNLNDGFPLMTTKSVPFKSVASELLWFLEGSSDERRLAEILHGTRDETKTTIWTANAKADYWKPKAKFDGDLGRVYGVQWRTWRGYQYDGSGYELESFEIDQLDQLIFKIKNNPTDRRLLLTAYNPGELDQMALPPCHMFAQFYVSNDRKLSCKMYQRSADLFLGVPFNIASYALLTHMIAHVCNLGVGNLTIDFGDVHVYSNHVEQVREQINRGSNAKRLPTLWLNPDITDIDSFTMTDIRIDNYEHLGAIKAPMAV